MEFTLNFNEMECKRFLIKEGYTIERYHGIVEDEFFHTLEGFTIILAYKERKDWSNIDKYHLTDQYQLNNVFQKVFNEKIKNVLLSW
jgi:hypothetical protein